MKHSLTLKPLEFTADVTGAIETAKISGPIKNFTDALVILAIRITDAMK
jgi:hypothetical protein